MNTPHQLNLFGDDIKVIDNFLDKKLFQHVQNIAYCRDVKWIPQSTNPEAERNFIMFDFAAVFEKEKWVLEKYKEIFYLIFDEIQKNLDQECYPGRVYFNRQAATVDGMLHLDDGDYTALLYISDYEKEYGGFTQLWISDQEQKYILPIPNRILIFNSLILHKGFGFSHLTDPRRISLAYKIYKKK